VHAPATNLGNFLLWCFYPDTADRIGWRVFLSLAMLQGTPIHWPLGSSNNPEWAPEFLFIFSDGLCSTSIWSLCHSPSFGTLTHQVIRPPAVLAKCKSIVCFADTQ